VIELATSAGSDTAASSTQTAPCRIPANVGNRERDRLRQSCLANAPRTRDRHEPQHLQQVSQHRDIVIAPDQRGGQRRNVGRQFRFGRRCGGGRAASPSLPVSCFPTLQLEHEAIAAPGHRGDRPTAENPPQRGDLNLEIVFLDRRLRPHGVEQLVLRDEVSRPLEERV
jgi:hypothetical protein